MSYASCRQTVITWRGRYERRGLAGLAMHPGRGDPARSTTTDRDGDADAAAEAARGDALVEPAAGRQAHDRPRAGGAGVEALRHSALAVPDIQVLHRKGNRGLSAAAPCHQRWPALASRSGTSDLRRLWVRPLLAAVDPS